MKTKTSEASELSPQKVATHLLAVCKQFSEGPASAEILKNYANVMILKVL